MHVHAEDPSLRPYKEPISVDRRAQLLAAMIAGAKNLYDMFREEGANKRAKLWVRLPPTRKLVAMTLAPAGLARNSKNAVVK